MTRDEVARVMLMLMGALRLSRPVVDVELLTDAWHLALADIDADEAQRAATVLLREGSYFPEPSAVRDLALQERTGIPSPDEGWGIIHGLINHRPWPNISQAAGAALLEAIRALGGLSYLRSSTQYQRDRDTFFKLWPQIRQRHMRFAQHQPRVASSMALTAVTGEEPESPPLPPGMMSYEDHFNAFYARQAEGLKEAPMKPVPRRVLDAGPGPSETRRDDA